MTPCSTSGKMLCPRIVSSRETNCFTLLYPSAKADMNLRFTVRWDPDCNEELVYIQSACLTCLFYYVQSFIHRQFILTTIGSRTSDSLVKASEVICLNAARSCGRILDHIRQYPRSRSYAFLHLYVSSFYSNTDFL